MNLREINAILAKSHDVRFNVQLRKAKIKSCKEYIAAYNEALLVSIARYGRRKSDKRYTQLIDELTKELVYLESLKTCKVMKIEVK